jgi:uncharacterized protein YaiE (UPF0345 family)
MEPVPVEFIIEGACVRGRFFPAVGKTPATTLLLFPGWPGDPNDDLGLGALLAEQGINACMFNPKGLQQSEGILSHANTLQDIGAVWQWLKQAFAKMELLDGGMDVLLPGRLDWQTFQAGETFEVPANSSFKLKLKVPVDYCCSYG